ncbi:MerR family transcriptional regulator/heat shock protein HspR [Motilibacter rhizosphaerae]|uniref:MerR family transcriptional regulator/heat shock protein HspR n=1 Tax=Motilibacter rhizosphaerae TaxID=598652 RepID=A0A4Q7NVT0_9ACTN|nr:helix-turn-helix transcriptional regulator [Motilibacter rhizosphaerae]RZS90988.1 MerR family transcriptional regulator/heat shock protein HspR [Motilibacter rhizosphaerae]
MSGAGLGGTGAPFDADAAVYVISVAAELSGLHPQTLRQYDRLGLVSPGRATGRGRRYSARDIAALREVQRLTADGVNLAGVKRILELELQVDALRARVAELQAELDASRASTDSRVRQAASEAVRAVRRDLVPFDRSATALVVWRPPGR